jgi:predicted nuclease of predicted toxin-antitoxin system
LKLSLLVDEDSQGKLLVSLLKKAGHTVETTNEAGLRTAPDSVVLAYAIANELVLLTQNCSDFVDLAIGIVEAGEHHPGVLLVYKDNDPSKDMDAATIVQAVKNLTKTKLSLADKIIVLNNYRN